MDQHDANCCDTCGSREIILESGFYYCQDCGAQKQGRRETEHEFGPFGMKIGERMAKSKKKQREEKEQKERVRKLRDDPYLCERALPTDDFPRWMDAVGTRLFTACKLVCKCAHEMVYQFGAPMECVEHAQRLFYTYLSKSGIAFCDEETTDNLEQAFCPLIKRTMQEIANLKAQQKREERARRKQRQKERLEQSSIWEQLTQPDLEECEEFAKLNTNEPEISLFERVNTALSISAINMAGIIYLGIDLLLGIVYMAALLSGCRWIQLSDIFRWYREGRFAISHSQICALNFATSWTVEHQRASAAEGVGGEMMARIAERRFFNRSKYLIPYLAIQPTCESLRVLTFLTQFIGIPRSVPTLEFDKVLVRLAYNLNLPRVFLKHLFLIKHFLPVVNVDYGAERFAHIHPIDTDLCTRLLWITAKHERGHIGFNSFMQRAFLSNHAEKRWYRENDDESGDILKPNSGNWHCAPLSSETKAAALILFALKLFFGLDGQREHLFKPRRSQTHSTVNTLDIEENDNYEDIEKVHRNNGQQTDESFNFDEWYAQLQLRTHCWQGTSAGIVLGKDFHSDQLERSDPTAVTNARETSKSGSQPTPLFHHARSVPFAGCVPNNLHNRAQPKLFENLFPTQYKPLPIPKDLQHDHPSMSKEALYTPLQYQAITNQELQQKDENNLDEHNVKLFFKRFYDTHMEFELQGKEAAALGKKLTIEQNAESFGDNTNNTNRNEIFSEIFPCANAFVRLPAPPIRCFALVIPGLDEHGLIVSRDITAVPLRLMSAPIAPILPHRQIRAALCVSEHMLSPSFRSLLRHLALAVSDAEHLLYFAYLMIEMLMYDRIQYDQIERDLRTYGRVAFSTQRQKMSGKPLYVRYTITLDNEGGNDRDDGTGVGIGNGQGMTTNEDRRKTMPTHQFRYKLTRANYRDRTATMDGIPTKETSAVDIAAQQIRIHPQNTPVQAQQTQHLENEIVQSAVGTSYMTETTNIDSDNENSAMGDSTSSLSSSSSESSSESDSEDSSSIVDPSTYSKKEKRHLRLISLPAPAAFALSTFRHCFFHNNCSLRAQLHNC